MLERLPGFAAEVKRLSRPKREAWGTVWLCTQSAPHETLTRQTLVR
jgi:hypothetical protein